MKEHYLKGLLAGLSALLVLRVLHLAEPDDETHAAPPVVEAVRSVQQRLAPAAPGVAMAFNVPRTARFENDGNAFAVRKLPPSSPPPPQAALSPQPFVGQVQPPPPVPPPLPPLQVIGTYNDAKGPSVFLAGPAGVRQGREAEVLFAQYRVDRITPTLVVLRDLSSDHEFPLTVPEIARTR